MDDNKLAIIIPAFSGHEQIVDHGPTDTITRWVNDAFPQTTCIRGSPELWWSGATNIGIRQALKDGSKWIMLLNHDCYMRPDTIGNLLKYIINEPGAVIAPVQNLLRSGRSIVGAMSCFLLGFPTIIPPPAWYNRHSSSALVPVHLIMGGRGVIFAADTFRRVGYLDEEHLPHYCADHDFYFRCRNAGLRLLICREAVVDIDDSMTTTADLDAGLSLQQFVASLKDRSSHRNIKDLQVLFSRYYPIPGLAPLGVALNTARFFSVYLAKTLARIMSRERWQN